MTSTLSKTETSVMDAIGGPSAGAEDRRWQAIVERDRSAADRFVYAVASTGIYCRPGCSSRRPLRRNVTFYAGPRQAEKAGYRACLKCFADGANAADIAAVRKACRIMDEAEGPGPRLTDLAHATGLEAHRLRRAFKRALGISPRQYRDAVRQTQLRENLRAGEPVAPALYGAGYGSASRLYEVAGRQLGMTPARYGRGGAGAVVAYAGRACALGWLLVAATEKGVCFVGLADCESDLVQALRADLPAAELVADTDGLGGMLEAVAVSLDGREPTPRLPLDIRATAFQRRVWEALCAIPRGETRSYAEIAAALGLPRGAARAVGTACGANPVSLLTPCHRVVGSDGALRGYRWGLERKRALLAREAEAAKG